MSYRDHSFCQSASCPFAYLINENRVGTRSRPTNLCNGASIQGIGFTHILSIVHMIYLSRKSLSLYTDRHRDEGHAGRREERNDFCELLLGEIAMGHGYLISKRGKTFLESGSNGHRPMTPTGAANTNIHIAPSFSFKERNEKLK